MNPKLQQIWSDEFWKEEATRIEMEYWQIIKKHIPEIHCVLGDFPTEHRIEKFVRELSVEKDIGNLHVGLTSSDLEDNVRIKRLELSFGLIEDKLTKMVEVMTERGCPDKNMIAYTHLMPASTTTIQRRMLNWGEMLGAVNSIEFIYKGIGGAIGDSEIQKLINGNWDGESENDFIFTGKECQEYPTQTVNHRTEYTVACAITWYAACLSKISNDIRQMFAFNQAIHTQKDVGSTAMAHKAPNPWRYERISGMAEMLYDLPTRVARVASSCLLERTLTNQSVLNYMFERAFNDLDLMIDDMTDALGKTEFIDQTKLCKNPVLHSEEEMLKLIKKGMPRLYAHKKIHEKYKNKK